MSSLADEIERLLESASQERARKIQLANEEYSESIIHIEWFKRKMEKSHGSLPKHKNSPEKQAEKSGHAKRNGESIASGVKAAIVALAEIGGQFTIPEALAWLDKNRPDLHASANREVIGGSLSRMGSAGIIKTVLRGSKLRAHIYERLK